MLRLLPECVISPRTWLLLPLLPLAEPNQAQMGSLLSLPLGVHATTGPAIASALRGTRPRESTSPAPTRERHREAGLRAPRRARSSRQTRAAISNPSPIEKMVRKPHRKSRVVSTVNHGRPPSPRLTTSHAPVRVSTVQIAATISTVVGMAYAGCRQCCPSNTAVQTANAETARDSAELPIRAARVRGLRTPPEVTACSPSEPPSITGLKRRIPLYISPRRGYHRRMWCPEVGSVLPISALAGRLDTTGVAEIGRGRAK